MEKNALLRALENGDFHPAFKILYPGPGEAAARYAEAVRAFERLFPDRKEIRLFSAPGRTEIGGNHTDHNHGCVLAGSVNLDVAAVCAKNGSDTVRIKSRGFEMDTVDLSDETVHENEKGSSAALIRGICARFKQLGHPVGGFDAYTSSDVLSGSGLSSSAAFEVLVCRILSGLFGADLAPVEMARISQYAENVYFGKPCGLMDQTACAVGGFVAIDFENPSSPRVERIGFDFRATGHTLCIVGTGGSHADLSDAYASIPLEMEQVARLLGVAHLRHADENLFFDRLPSIRAQVGDRALLRAMHFFADNRRAQLQARALRSGDFNGFLALVNESGRSSCMYLQNVVNAGDPRHQELMLGLALSDRLLSGRGAFRVHGGGFAGTLQAYVPTELLASYRASMEAVFGAGSCHTLSIRPAGAVEVTPQSVLSGGKNG